VDAFSKVYGGTPPSGWKTDFDMYRRTHLDRQHASWYGDDADMARLIEVYEADLRKRGSIDFDDMVLLGLRLIEDHEWVRRCLRARFPILAVDEYQDLGMPLHRIVLSLCFKAGVRLFAVGDPDQSIYGFAGAKPELLEDLSNIPGIQKIHLQFNYRAGQSIIDAAEAVLGEVRGYRATGQTESTINFYKCPQGLEQQAEHICTTIIPAALARRNGRSLGDVAVLYLDWRDGEVIEKAVRDAQMKFLRLDRGAPYAKTPLNRWIEECAAWCAGGWKSNSPRLTGLLKGWEKFNPTVRSESAVLTLRLELVRFLFSRRDASLRAQDWLSEFDSQLLHASLSTQPTLRDEAHAFAGMKRACSDEGKLSELTLGALGGQSGGSDHLNLITLHSAKGLEFDVVVMMGMDQGRIPNYRANTLEKKREPRRLFYVGLTRARHEVHLTCSGFTLGPGGRRFDNGPSEFMKEVAKKLKAPA
jgi:DNA helicase-2/ATP-dependent DNA helicase PcrA